MASRSLHFELAKGSTREVEGGCLSRKPREVCLCGAQGLQSGDPTASEKKSPFVKRGKIDAGARKVSAFGRKLRNDKHLRAEKIAGFPSKPDRPGAHRLSGHREVACRFREYSESTGPCPRQGARMTKLPGATHVSTMANFMLGRCVRCRSRLGGAGTESAVVPTTGSHTPGVLSRPRCC